MRTEEFVQLLEKNRKRFHVAGNEKNTCLVAVLDLEGRIFTAINGVVVNRVNPEAFNGISTKDGYLNPGGDGLWPAPEGTCLGYEYSCGTWRVPPGLTNARYILKASTDKTAEISAEIDLVNSEGLGIPTLFTRKMTIDSSENTVTVTQDDSIEYLGTLELDNDRCLLVPWTLCQFDCGPGCEVVFPCPGPESVWDLYDSSESKRKIEGGFCRASVDGSMRYQIAMGKDVEYLEFINPQGKIRAKRSASLPPSAGHEYIDISDAPPETKPGKRGVKLSAYCDGSDFFMEIEAAGACPPVIKQGSVMSVESKTVYTWD